MWAPPSLQGLSPRSKNEDHAHGLGAGRTLLWRLHAARDKVQFLNRLRASQSSIHLSIQRSSCFAWLLWSTLTNCTDNQLAVFGKSPSSLLRQDYPPTPTSHLALSDHLFVAKTPFKPCLIEPNQKYDQTLKDNCTTLSSLHSEEVQLITYLDWKPKNPGVATSADSLTGANSYQSFFFSYSKLLP